MTKKIILSSFFICAIGAGLGVGYLTIALSKVTYAYVSEYISEIRTDLVFEGEPIGKGGPYSQVIESEFNNETISEYTKSFYINPKAQIARVSSLSYLIADIETGKVFASQNINQQLPIASLTKLMVAIVADETLGLETQTTVTQQAIDTYGTQGNLRRGEQYTIGELLYPLLLESSNDAGEAIALSKNRDEFMKAMNTKAQTLGLRDTAFDDASGLSVQNVSTVTDLFRLSQYIYKYRNYVFDITTLQTHNLRNKKWYNNSRFRSDRKYIGGKNGYIDEARRTHVVLFEEKISDEKRPVLYIILRSDDVAYDIRMLRDFVYKNVEYR